MQSFLMRLMALMIWVPSIYLTWWLIAEFTEGQSQIIAGIAFISLLVSAVSLLNARYAFKRGDKVWAWGSIAMYVLGAVVMIFLELGYWNSTILGSHTNMVRAESAREGVELLKEQQRDQMRTGQAPASAGEIQAQMDVQLATPIGNQPLGRLTKGCTDQQSAAFRLCGEFLTLKAAHAKATKIEEIQGIIWKDGTSVETSQIKKDIFSGATAIANLVGGSPRVWASILSAAMMLLLMMTRDVSGIGAFGPAMKLVGTAPQPAAEPATAPAEQPVSAPSAPVPAPEPEEEPALPDPASLAPLSRPRPPSGGGPRKTAPAARSEPVEAVSAQEVAESRVIPFEAAAASLPPSAFFDESSPPVKRLTAQRRREDKRKKAIGAAKSWVRDCTMRSSDPAVTVSREEAWAHYREWCEMEGVRELPQSTFHRAVNAKIGSAGGRTGYIGLMLVDINPEQMRAYG